jgi:Arc/MetJ-type ribon-helix-helix transcriptional regulator|tara:strand:+ start:30 stop:179 length:150 start_codon:yes stop_codon:yes gene_type:complete
MINKKNTDLMTFRMPSKLKRDVETLAIENESTSSEVIRYALNKLLTKNA